MQRFGTVLTYLFIVTVWGRIGFSIDANKISPVRESFSTMYFKRSLAIIPSVLLVAGGPRFDGSNTMLLAVEPSYAAQQVVVSPNDVNRLKLGLREINYLLDHWEEKTTYCNFGEFQRELLLPENKEALMKAAKETGLLDYDKSKTMRVMCKRDPEVVRAFIGMTKDNLLLSKADVLMRKPSTVEMVDPDHIDEYFEAVETFTQAIAAADSLAYQARTDYGSQESTSKEAALEAIKIAESGGKKDYLDQSKSALETVRDSLTTITNDLGL
jgi:hypothetical protein